MNQNPNLQEAVRHGSLLFPLEYYHCVFPANIADLPVHWHKEFEITLVRKGSCTYQIDLETYQIAQGDLLILPPETLHGTGGELEAEFITDSFVFDLDMLTSQIPDSCTTQFFVPLASGKLRFPVHIPTDDQAAGPLREAFEAVRQAYEKKSFGYELEIKSRLLHLFFLLCSLVPCQRNDRKNREITDKLKLVLQYIRENYQNPVTIRELAEICHFSEYHFMRFFKQHMNMTCIEYLNLYRLGVASRRLIETDLSIISIAMEAGFNNISYFNRVFKGRFGITPREFRLENRGRV